MQLDPNKMRSAPGHPIKYLFHRSMFDLGSSYKNVVNWEFDKTKTFHRKNLLAHFGCVNAIEFSKDGCLLASGGDDRRVLLWKVDKALVSKTEPCVMQAEHLSNVFSLDFTCSSKKLISAGNDDQVILHDVETGVPLDYFVHEQPVYGVSADPVNEKIFCSACDDGRILIYDTRESGTESSEPFCLAKATSSFHSVMFHPVEPRLIVTSNSKEGVSCWDVRMPKKTFVKYGMQNSGQCCMSARFNRLGSQILVLRRRLPPILYSTDSPSHLYQFNHRGYYNSCTMKSCSFAGKDDQYVVSGSDNFDVHVWKIPSPGSDQWVNKADVVLRGHRSIVNQVRYNYAHNVIASSGVEKIVKLWSPFPMPDERGGKAPTVITNESKRRIYTPDDYVSLVMQAGQGHFMSLTFEGGRKTTREDSRMLAFFDALVQRDINGVSDEESDTVYETSYTNTVYTSPETSSSDDDDDDSNPPDYRSLLSAERNSNSFRGGLTQSSETNPSINDHNETVEENTATAETPTNFNSTNIINNVNIDRDSDANDYVAGTSAVLNQSRNLNEPSSTVAEPSQQIDGDGEDKDATTNMITRLILERQENRRKNQSRYHRLRSRSSKQNTDSGDESVTSEDSNNEVSANRNSTSRPLQLEKRPYRSKKQSRSKKTKHGKHFSKFRKHMLEIRRRERITSAVPVYESSRNAQEDVTVEATSFRGISELMTRNQAQPQSDSSLDSSSSSSSDSSSSDKDCVETENSKDRRKKCRTRTKKSKKDGLSDTNSSSDANNNDTDDDMESTAMHDPNRPSTSGTQQLKTSTGYSISSNASECKRKRKPQCKLTEACKAYFNQYIDPGVNSQRSNASSSISHSRDSIENSGGFTASTITSESTGSLVERVVFKRFSKHTKGRNYRRVSTTVNSGTPPDSGVDVSKEQDDTPSNETNEQHQISIPTQEDNTAQADSTNNINESPETLDAPENGRRFLSDSSDD